MNIEYTVNDVVELQLKLRAIEHRIKRLTNENLSKDPIESLKGIADVVAEEISSTLLHNPFAAVVVRDFLEESTGGSEVLLDKLTQFQSPESFSLLELDEILTLRTEQLRSKE